MTTWNEFVRAWYERHGGSFKDALRNASPAWRALQQRSGGSSPSKRSPTKRSPTKRTKRSPSKRSAHRSRSPSLRGGGALFAPCGSFPRVAMQSALAEGRDLTYNGVTLPIARLSKTRRAEIAAQLKKAFDAGGKFKVFVTATGDVNVNAC